MTTTIKSIAAVAAVVSFAAFAHAAEMDAQKKAVYEDIGATFGSVPTFVKQLPDASLGGFWKLEKDLELSGHSALPPKTKALISLAVAAQIPCEYCIAADTATAKRLGASDAEIGEAVAMAGLTRYSSTVFNGLQVDLATFKKEVGAQ